MPRHSLALALLLAAASPAEARRLEVKPLPPPGPGWRKPAPVDPTPTATPPLDPVIEKGAEATLASNWRGTETWPSPRRRSTWKDPLPAGGFKRNDGRRGKYEGGWLWDSVFQSIVLGDLGFTEHARTELRTVVGRQERSGFIRHMEPKLLGLLPSRLTQPPILAIGALHLADKGVVDVDIYSRIVRFHGWLSARKADRDGLLPVTSALESGQDTSPIFDSAHWGAKRGSLPKRLLYYASRLARDGYNQFAPRFLPKFKVGTKPVTFNALYARDLEAAAELAERLGRKEEAATFRARYHSVRQAMRAEMRDPARPFLFLSLDRHGRQIQVKTHDLLMPLYAGLLEPGEARQLVRYVTDPRNGLWTEYPLPSTATTEPTFDPKDYWRGPSWINMNFFAMEGLLRYGYHREAKQLYERTVSLYQKNPGPMGFNESYDPRTGQAVRQGQLGWSTLIVSMERSLRRYERAHHIR